MKLLQGTLKLSGYLFSRLVDPEDLDLLRFEDTGELADGLDFALWWQDGWREGRCYSSIAGRTFVTYGDAQRLPLSPGMHTRRSNYVLEHEQLLELADTYASELGYTDRQPGHIVGENTAIAVGENADVTFPMEDGQPPVVITISLHSNGDIRLLSSNEAFLGAPPQDPEVIPG
ncbi:MAG: hypothetical protein ACYDER_03170 [Ktedonobacteraceae bacterium]